MVSTTLILQAAPSLSSEKTPYKVGFTTTKKIGKAHVRNRARRRLRAAVREIFPKYALENVEYVLIARYNTADCPYKSLKGDLRWTLKKANKMIQNGIYTSERPEKNQNPKTKNTPPKTQKKNLLVLMVRFYQKFISPLCAGCCRFRPTCSQYMIEAIQTHGTIKGLYLGIRRILRCHPFGKSGYDPVPEKKSESKKKKNASKIKKKSAKH